MQINFSNHSQINLEDKLSLKGIRKTLVNQLENLPKSEVNFKIVSIIFLDTKHKLFQGQLVVPFIKSRSFKWLCNQSETIFNLPNRIDKIWMILQILNCCTTFELDRPFVEFKEFSPIINPFLILAFNDEQSTLRELPNDILRVIAKIILVCDLKENANAFGESIKKEQEGNFALQWLFKTAESEHLREYFK